MFHCFSGDSAAAERALATGFFVSIPGIVTFPRADTLREAARLVPEHRLFVETDSPFLAPVPFRGHRNEPAYVVKTLEMLARVRGAAVDALAARLVNNFDELFGVASSARTGEPDTIWRD